MDPQDPQALPPSAIAPTARINSITARVMGSRLGPIVGGRRQLGLALPAMERVACNMEITAISSRQKQAATLLEGPGSRRG